MKDLPEEPIKAMQKVLEKYQEASKSLETVQAEVDGYKEKADRFDAYYDAKVAEAIKEGVTAHGDEFDSEKWTKILKGYNDLSLIDIHLEKWKGEADENLPEEEKRQTKSSSGDDKTKTKTKPDVPDYDDYEDYR